MYRIQNQTRDEMIMEDMNKFYNKDKNLNIFYNIKTNKSKIALRLLEYFTVTYSNKNKINYKLNGKDYYVYIDYQSHLKAYTKKYFDAYSRGKRIIFIDKFNRQITTTIAQLNFMAWIIKHKIINYVEKNLKTIIQDEKQNKTKKKIVKRTKKK